MLACAAHSFLSLLFFIALVSLVDFCPANLSTYLYPFPGLIVFIRLSLLHIQRVVVSPSVRIIDLAALLGDLAHSAESIKPMELHALFAFSTILPRNAPLIVFNAASLEALKAAFVQIESNNLPHLLI